MVPEYAQATEIHDGVVLGLGGLGLGEGVGGDGIDGVLLILKLALEDGVAVFNPGGHSLEDWAEGGVVRHNL